MERLRCDRCGRTYTDPKDIEWAKQGAEHWKRMVIADGDIPRGISPCPIITCNGELILEE